MNPHTKRSELLGQLVKVAAELDWHTLVELRHAARRLQSQAPEKAESEKASAATTAPSRRMRGGAAQLKSRK